MRNWCVLIPSTFTADEKNRLLRTYKIGLMARYVSIFGVPRIIIYYDEDPKFESHGLGKFISKILSYCNCPPWLRKLSFGLSEDLKYVGHIEPLRTIHHEREILNDHTWAVVDSVKKGYAEVTYRKNKRFRKTKCKIIRKHKERDVILINLKQKIEVLPYELNFFFGYDVRYINRPLHEVLDLLDSEGYRIIGLSRYGKRIREVQVNVEDKLALVFGGPFRGILNILSEEYYPEVIVNLINNQNTKTIRTEEAVLMALTLFNHLVER